MSKKRKAPRRKPRTTQPKPEWKTVFDAKPMAHGMPPRFLLQLLDKQQFFVRHGKLLTASLWLQSQMAGAICLQDDADLRERCTVDHGRHLPTELGRATTKKLEHLSSESLRKEFHRCFHTSMSDELLNDLQTVVIFRDALSHGYISLLDQIINSGREHLFWSPRPSPSRDITLKEIFGSRDKGPFLRLSLSPQSFKAELERISRLMDFIALRVKEWGIPYPVFA